MKLLHTIHDTQGRVIGLQMAGEPARAVQLWRAKNPASEPLTARNCNTPTEGEGHARTPEQPPKNKLR